MTVGLEPLHLDGHAEPPSELPADPARGELPALVVLDLRMPDAAGYEFRKAQLADDEVKVIPVVVYSSDLEIADVAAQIAGSHWHTRARKRLRP